IARPSLLERWRRAGLGLEVTMTQATVRTSSRAPSSSSDADALARIARGDVSGIGALYDRHAAALLRFAARITTAAAPQDLVQETFVKVARIAASFDGRTPDARAWLFGILAHLVQERRRSIARCAKALLRFGAVSDRVDPCRSGPNLDLERGLDRLSP